MSTSAPGSSARRSRRGYYFQDLWALHYCLKMLGGAWETVTCEGDEDITCAVSGSTCHIQVKSEEYPAAPWTIARLCQREGGDAARSMLGRLFSAKPLSESVTFRLVGNVPLHRGLRPLTMGSSEDRTPAEDDIVRRLDSVTVQNGKSVRWCTERLTVEFVGGDADHLEDRVYREIGAEGARVGLPLLTEELDALLGALVGRVAEAARQHDPEPLARDDFGMFFGQAARAAMRDTGEAQGPDAQPLADKLAAAGLDSGQIRRFQAEQWEYSRRYRTALEDRTQLLDYLSSEIMARCASLSLAMRAGALAPGAGLFQATVEAVREVHEEGNWAARGVELAVAYGALHDITARCQHRYES